MNWNVLFQLLFIVLHYAFYSNAHSVSGSSALATGSIKFRNSQTSRGKNIIGRNKKIGIHRESAADDDQSKFSKEDFDVMIKWFSVLFYL